MEQKELSIISDLVLQGDISKMNDEQRVKYYNGICQKLGLNPLTQPFQIIKFQNKEVLYATKDCTEQLRKIYGVSIIDMSSRMYDDIMVVQVKAQDNTGRSDVATGAVTIGNAKGDQKANLIMKAETKAKR